MVDYWVLFKQIEYFISTYSIALKWFASFCFVFATVILISPEIAAKSVLPFVLYFIGNTIWLIDSFVKRQFAWVFTGLFFATYDGILIHSRYVEVDTSFWLNPFVQQLNYYLL